MSPAPMRYEYGAWPRWRVDKNIRYQLKGLLHVKRADKGTTEHFAAMADYLKRFANTDERDAQVTKHLTIAAVGDVMWIGKDSSRSVSPTVKQLLDKSDLRLLNLETPIDSSKPVPRYTYDLFNSSDDLLAPWTDHGRTSIFSLCNNHGLDHGVSGVKNTRSAIRLRPSAHCIGGEHRDDAFVGTTIGNTRICATGMTFGSNRYDGTIAGIPQVRLGDPHAEPDWESLRQWIAHCRLNGPDLVVIMAHWGFEYEYWPETLQREHAYRLIAMGVDIIIGSSPHVLQPIDVVSVNGWDTECPVQLSGQGGKRQGLIAYSLGNFVTRMMLPACRISAILEIGASWDDNGSMSITKLVAHPAVAIKRNGVCTTVTLQEYESAVGPAANMRTHLTRSLNSIITN